MASELGSNAEGWITPAGAPSWVRWGFGTRHSPKPKSLASVHQVHGAAVLTVKEEGVAGDADGLITTTPGLLLGIKTADCLPILLVDVRQRAVGAVHAGWRGTAQHIVQAAICEMQRHYETKPNDLLAALGPAIGPCCFEVGPEVAHEFRDFNPELGKVMGKCHLDLPAINQRQLEQAGVSSTNVFRTDLCTVCNREQFWSYRREREQAGRMWSLVGIED